jgi:hypothetical protein
MKAPTEQVPSTSAVVAAVHPTPEFTAPISSLRLNDVPTPPYAVDTPGLAQSPEKVGRDPGRVHFTLPAMSGASSVRAARWSVAEGVETVEIWTPDDRLRQLAVQVQVARTEALLTRLSLACCTWDPIERTKTHEARVRGQVATVEVTTDHNKQANGHHRTMVIWQPAAEVWASVQSFDLGEESVVAMANRVDFTRSVRCVTPLVPTHLPDDLTQVGCSMWLQGAVQAPEALLPQAWTYLADKKDGHDVSVAVLSDAIDATTADWQGSTDDGIKALWYGGEDPHLRLVDFHGLIVDVRPGRDDRELATWIADGLRLSGDPWRPQSWPARLTRTAD